MGELYIVFSVIKKIRFITYHFLTVWSHPLIVFHEVQGSLIEGEDSGWSFK